MPLNAFANAAYEQITALRFIGNWESWVEYAPPHSGALQTVIFDDAEDSHYNPATEVSFFEEAILVNGLVRFHLTSEKEVDEAVAYVNEITSTMN